MVTKNSIIVKRLLSDFSPVRGIVLNSRTKKVVRNVSLTSEEDFLRLLPQLESDCAVFLCFNAGEARQRDKITHLYFISIDIDNIPPDERRARAQEIIETCEKWYIPPMYVLSTGKGLHIHWRLAGESTLLTYSEQKKIQRAREKNKPSPIPSFEEVQSALVAVFGADKNAVGRERVWRVDGTLYNKYGAENKVIELIYQNESVEPRLLKEIAECLESAGAYDFGLTKSKQQTQQKKKANGKGEAPLANGGGKDVVEKVIDKVMETRAEQGERHDTLLAIAQGIAFAQTITEGEVDEETISQAVEKYAQSNCANAEDKSPEEINGLVKWAADKPAITKKFTEKFGLTYEDINRMVLSNELTDEEHQVAQLAGLITDTHQYIKMLSPIVAKRLPGLVHYNNTFYCIEGRILEKIPTTRVKKSVECLLLNLFTVMQNSYAANKNVIQLMGLKNLKTTMLKELSVESLCDMLPALEPHRIKHTAILQSNGEILGPVPGEDILFYRQECWSVTDRNEEYWRDSFSIFGEEGTPNHELAKFLAMYWGTSYNVGRVIVILHGPVQGGKSTHVKKLIAVYGKHRIGMANIQSLAGNSASDLNASIIKLHDASAVFIDEADKVIDTTVIKQLLTNDVLLIRPLYSPDVLEIDAGRLTPILAMNEPPRFDKLDSGFLGKTVVLQVPNSLPPQARETVSIEDAVKMAGSLFTYCHKEYEMCRRQNVAEINQFFQPYIEAALHYIGESQDDYIWFTSTFEVVEGSSVLHADVVAHRKRYIDLTGVKLSMRLGHINRVIELFSNNRVRVARNSQNCSVFLNLAFRDGEEVTHRFLS